MNAKNNRTKKTKDSRNLIPIISSFLMIILLYNISITNQYTSEIDEKINLAEELLKPAMIDAILITANDCTDCDTLDSTIAKINSSSDIDLVSLKTRDISSDEGKSLARQYGIKQLPAIIITGQTDKTQNVINAIESADGIYNKDMIALITPTKPIYYDIETATTIGDVKATIITDDSCESCINIDSLISQIEAGGITIIEKENLEHNSTTATDLISEYNINKLPALIFSSDFGEYEGMNALWSPVGSVEDDGSFVLRNISAPYLDLDTGKVVGLMTVISLTDNTCDECYDAKVHEDIIGSMGGVIATWTDIDISTDKGKDYIERYNITSIPTILLSEDADRYPQLVSVWPSVGTFESDGTLVFRKNEVMTGMTYKNILTGEIIS